MMDTLLKERKAATVISVAVQTLRNRRSQGLPPKYVKIGKSVRYRPEDLRKFINDRVIDPK